MNNMKDFSTNTINIVKYSFSILNHVIIFRCTLTCHTGECSLPEACKKKVKLYCPCKRKKQEMQCHKSKSVKLKCDEECKQILDQVTYY